MRSELHDKLDRILVQLERMGARLDSVERKVDEPRIVNVNVDESGSRFARTVTSIDRPRLIPTGTYPARIHSAERRKSRGKGKKYWSVEYRLLSSTDYPGFRVWGNHVEHVPSPFDELCEATGYELSEPVHEVPDEVLEEVLDGKVVNIRVEASKAFNGKRYNTVRAVSPYYKPGGTV